MEFQIDEKVVYVATGNCELDPGRATVVLIHGVGQWMLGSTVRLLERSAPGVLYADLKACHQFQMDLERARNISSPALLVLGRRDSMTPVRAAGDLRRALAKVETVILEGAGHALLSERPDEVLDALIRIV